MHPVLGPLNVCIWPLCGQVVDWPATWVMFASVGAIGAALVTAYYASLVYATLHEMQQQRRVLESQRDEMRQQRSEMEQQRQEMVNQVREAVQERIDNSRPVVTFEIVGPYMLAIKNIGKGPALDVELRLSQVHENGGLTNLRNFIENDAERNLLNLGENERVELGGTDNVRAYAFAEAPPWQWGHRDVFAAISSYSDINRRNYYTVALVRSLHHGNERRLVMKSTKTAPFENGTVEQLNVLDWIK